MAKWILNKNKTLAKCDNCRFSIKDKEEISLLGTSWALYRYCPYCGEKMEKATQMKITYTDSNECDFAIVILDKSKKDKAVECIKNGIDAWYSATDPEHYEGNAFTKDEIEGFYWEGYAEPTCELLRKEGIEFELDGVESDENGNFVTDELIRG